jgi:hypothetical protein
VQTQCQGAGDQQQKVDNDIPSHQQEIANPFVERTIVTVELCSDIDAIVRQPIADNKDCETSVVGCQCFNSVLAQNRLTKSIDNEMWHTPTRDSLEFLGIVSLVFLLCVLTTMFRWNSQLEIRHRQCLGRSLLCQSGGRIARGVGFGNSGDRYWKSRTDNDDTSLMSKVFLSAVEMLEKSRSKTLLNIAVSFRKPDTHSSTTVCENVKGKRSRMY